MWAVPDTLEQNDDRVVEERPLLAGDELVAFEEDPLNRVLYGNEWTPDSLESTLVCGFLNVNGLCKEKWKEKKITQYLNLYLTNNLILLDF